MKMEDTYMFRSLVSLAEMITTFNRMGPWRWIEELRGEQIAASLPAPARGTITIVAMPDRYSVDIAVAADTRHVLESIYDTLLFYLLPAVDSSDIRRQPRGGPGAN